MKKLLILTTVLSAAFLIGCAQSAEGEEPKATEMPAGKTLEFTEGTEGTSGGGAAAPTSEGVGANSVEPLPEGN